MTQIKAVVFDMDGVLIDSEQYYQDRLMAYFRAMEVDLPPQRLNLLVGANGKMNLWPKILEGITLPQPYDEFMVGLREYRHAQGIEDYRPLLFPGVEETLKQLKARGKKLALASSSSFASIEKMLSDTGLYAYFELVTSGGMFKESKPNPEIYLFTAKKLKLDPHQVKYIFYLIHSLVVALLFQMHLKDHFVNGKLHIIFINHILNILIGQLKKKV